MEVSQEPWEIRRYVDDQGVRPFATWLSKLDQKTKARVAARLDRVADGNFGDHKSVGGGVYELRLFFGPGYRIYYGVVGRRIILLLAGGDKKNQSKDIKIAKRLLDSYKSN